MVDYRDPTTPADIPPAPVRPSAAEENMRRVGRPPGRLTREAIREEPVREPIRATEGERLQRRRKRTENPFDIPQHMVPDGMSYEWKRQSCFGQPDIQHQIALQDNHWKPVPASRHPHMMPPDKQGGAVERDGMVLMERPAYLTEEARQEDYNEACRAVQIKEQQMGRTPQGTMTRAHGGAGVQIRHSYEPLVVPKE